MTRALSNIAIIIASLAGMIAVPSAKAIRQPSMPTTMLPLEIDRVVIRNGGLVAIGSLGSHQFESPLELRLADDNTGGATCPILNLQLNAIQLDLLGLLVETSDICLDITAQDGSGELLGNLLCSVAGLLDQGGVLGDILDGLTAAQLSDLLDGLANLLNEVLGKVTAPSSIVGLGGNAAGILGGGKDCDVLHLALGPVDLNLLGLLVGLDDCDNGPVTVDISAQAGGGRLLGNLLCNLTHLLDRNAGGPMVTRIVNRIANEILNLL